MITKNVAELMRDHVVLEVESGKGRSKGLPTTPCSSTAVADSKRLKTQHLQSEAEKRVPCSQ
jgi:hypothetical protein